MTPNVWSFVLSAIGVFGLYLAGSSNRGGWLVGLFAQFLWITYALATKQYGFIFASICYAAVYARNYMRAPARSSGSSLDPDDRDELGG